MISDKETLISAAIKYLGWPEARARSADADRLRRVLLEGYLKETIPAEALNLSENEVERLAGRKADYSREPEPPAEKNPAEEMDLRDDEIDSAFSTLPPVPDEDEEFITAGSLKLHSTKVTAQSMGDADVMTVGIVDHVANIGGRSVFVQKGKPWTGSLHDYRILARAGKVSEVDV